MPADPSSEVSFTASGYVERSFDLAELPSDEPWIIALEPCTTIEERVIGPDGTGLAGVEVMTCEDHGHVVHWRRDLTDRTVHFRVRGLETENVDLLASLLPEGLVARRAEDVPAGARGVVLEAVLVLSIEGWLTGVLDGLPGRYGVKLDAVGHRTGPYYATMQLGGAFSADDLLPGLYEVHAFKQIGRSKSRRSEPVRVYAGTGGLVFELE